MLCCPHFIFKYYIWLCWWCQISIINFLQSLNIENFNSLIINSIQNVSNFEGYFIKRLGWTAPPPPSPTFNIRSQRINSGRIDWNTFFSASFVYNFSKDVKIEWLKMRTYIILSKSRFLHWDLIKVYDSNQSHVALGLLLAVTLLFY